MKAGASHTASTVFDAATNAAWAGTEVTGAKAYDTATVSHSTDRLHWRRSPIPSSVAAAARARAVRRHGHPDRGWDGPQLEHPGTPGGGLLQLPGTVFGRRQLFALEGFLRTIRLIRPRCRAGPSGRAGPDHPGLRAGDGLMGAWRRIILVSGVLAVGLALVGALVVTSHGSDRPSAQPSRLPPLPDRGGAESSVSHQLAVTGPVPAKTATHSPSLRRAAP